MGYEIASIEVFLSVNFIFTILAISLNNKILRLFFVFLTVLTIPLSISAMKQILLINNTGSLNNLISLADNAYFISVFSGIFVVAYLIINIIFWLVDRFRVIINNRNKESEFDEVLN